MFLLNNISIKTVTFEQSNYIIARTSGDKVVRFELGYEVGVEESSDEVGGKESSYRVITKQSNSFLIAWSHTRTRAGTNG